MKIERVLTGPVETNLTNVWLLEQEQTGQVVIVDPGADADKIRAVIEQRNVRPAGILLTHGHFDHISAVEELRQRYRIPVYASEREREVLKRPELNFSAKRLEKPVVVHADVYLQDGETFVLGGLSIRTIATPGHTAGSCCYYLEAEEALISGDTIFAGRHGRIDLITSVPEAMMDSVLHKLMVLPPQTKVYPGHGDTTTIAAEQKVYGVAER